MVPSPSVLTVRDLWRAEHTRSLRVALVALAGLAVAIAAYWSALLGGQQAQRDDAQAQSRLRAGQMALGVSIQVQTLLAGLDYTLQSLAEVHAARDAGAFDQAVQAIYRSYPSDAVLQIAVADAQGRITYSSLEPGGRPQAAVSIQDREHFQTHVRGQTPGLFVGRPVLGRVSQRWTIQLSRAVRQDGGLTGVLVLSLAPEHIAQYFRAIAGEGWDVVALVRDDGAYLARSQRLQAVLGNDLPPERRQLFEPGQTRGTYEAVSPIDGVERQYAWSRVPGWPLLALVGLDRQAQLGPLGRQQDAALLRNALATAAIVLGALLMLWLALQRVRSDEKRLRAERHFARLAQEAPGGLFRFRVDADGSLRMAFTTLGFRAAHGLPPDADLRDMRALNHSIHRADLPALAASMRASLAARSPWDHKYRVNDPAAPGGVRWLHSHARPQSEEDGTLLWYGHVRDVTHDQALQESIRQSEERLRATVHAVRDGLWEWDIASGRVRWDERCHEMLGYSGSSLQLDRENFLSRVHPADRERLRQSLRRHFDTGEEFRIEVRMRTASRGWRSVEARGQVTQRGDNGLPLRMLGTQTDIQQRVDQARLISALLDRGSALVLVATPARDISYINERAAQAFGLASGKQDGSQPFRALHPDEDSYQRFGALYDTLKQIGVVRTEWRLRMASGQLHWFDIQGTLLDPLDEDGAVIWTLIDTDARRRAEEALETLALTDALTGVPNRRAFLERLDTELQHLHAALVPGAAIVLLDIDHFKRVNDTYGHASGDVVLRELAQTVARRLRRQDMLGRIGGEEFAVLLSGATPEVALQRAEELRQAVAEQEIRLDSGTVLSITISLGVYGMAAQDETAAQCLERADAAMYFSKRNGRNRSTLWSADLPAMDAAATGTAPHLAFRAKNA